MLDFDTSCKLRRWCRDAGIANRHAIYGALRYTYYENAWELYKRVGMREEEDYVLRSTYDSEPDPDEMTKQIWG